MSNVTKFLLYTWEKNPFSDTLYGTDYYKVLSTKVILPHKHPVLLSFHKAVS